ncbi:MAG: hypothetical protein R3E95_19170 [Thiolinea sp.]
MLQPFRYKGWRWLAFILLLSLLGWFGFGWLERVMGPGLPVMSASDELPARYQALRNAAIRSAVIGCAP